MPNTCAVELSLTFSSLIRHQRLFALRCFLRNFDASSCFGGGRKAAACAFASTMVGGTEGVDGDGLLASESAVERLDGDGDGDGEAVGIGDVDVRGAEVGACA